MAPYAWHPLACLLYGRVRQCVTSSPQRLDGPLAPLRAMYVWTLAPHGAGRLEMHAEAAAQLRNLGVTVDVRAATRGRPPLTPDMVGMTGCCSVRAGPCTLTCAQACSGALCQGAA